MTRTFLSWVALAAIIGGGCAIGMGVDDQRSQWSLGEPGVGGLEMVPPERWAAARASCDGLLSGDENFALAATSGGLVAALRGNEVLCVDDIDDIERELAACGHGTIAADLAASYDGLRGADPVAADPDPQPSKPGRLAADPDPQPSTPPPDGTDPGSSHPS